MEMNYIIRLLYGFIIQESDLTFDPDSDEFLPYIEGWYDNIERDLHFSSTDSGTWYIGRTLQYWDKWEEYTSHTEWALDEIKEKYNAPIYKFIQKHNLPVTDLKLIFRAEVR